MKNETIDRHERIDNAIWRWQDDGFGAQDQSANPLRRQAFWRVVLMTTFATIFYYLELRAIVPVILFFACLTAILAALSPTGLYLSMDRGANAIMKGFTRLLQWLILPLIYFCFFAPYGSIFRRGSSDRMKRNLDTGQQSYWLPVTQKHDRKNQF
jgi:hypothetical protein